MRKNQLFIGILVIIFCLGLSGVAVSETGIDNPQYQLATVIQPDSSMDRSLSASDQMTNFETEGNVPINKGMRADTDSQKRLLCANSLGTTSEPVRGNCG